MRVEFQAVFQHPEGTPPLMLKNLMQEQEAGSVKEIIQNLMRRIKGFNVENVKVSVIYKLSVQTH